MLLVCLDACGTIQELIKCLICLTTFLAMFDADSIAVASKSLCPICCCIFH